MQNFHPLRFPALALPVPGGRTGERRRTAARRRTA
jgi:hypothetical protein